MKKLIFVISFMAVFGLLFNVGAPSVKAATAAELQALIQQLQAQITALQQQLAQIQGGQPVTWCHTFNVNLKIGDARSEVTALQTALSKEGLYTRGTTGTFDEYTTSTVVGFQEKYASEVLAPWGLTHGTGYVGPTTRAKLNKIYGCGVVRPYIKVLSPNGGEVFVQGQSNIIKWKGGQPTQSLEPGKGPVAIALFNEAGEKQIGSIYSIVWPDSSYTWDAKRVCAGFNYEVGINCFDISPGRYRIWVGIRDGSAKDLSDAPFSIISSTSTCTDSDGGLNFYEKGTVTWVDANAVKRSSTDGCRYDGITLAEVYCSDNPDVAYQHTCPSGCKDGACVSATTTPSITVLSPNGGEQWVQGNTYDITWTSSGVEKIYMNLVYSNGASAWVAGGIEASLGKYAWTISSNIPTGDRLKIIITAEEQVFFPALQDESDNYFSIVEEYVPSTLVPFPVPLSPGGGATIDCTDSDGGLDYDVKGTVTCGSTVNTDVCSASGYLFEQHCLNGLPCQATYWCPYGCQDGACLQEAPPSIISISPTSGIVNDTITIYGQSLFGTKPSGIIVEFLEDGGLAGSVSSPITESSDGLSLEFLLSGTFIETQGAGTYQVRVTNDHGTSNTVNFIITTENIEEMLVPGYNFYVKTSDTGTGNWNFAKNSCEALGSGWSLPTMAQLRILYQKKNEIGGFRDQAYWSSESGKYIHFRNGFENSMNTAMTFPAFRCVKGADGVGLKTIEDQLASLAEVVSKLIEQVKNLIWR